MTERPSIFGGNINIHGIEIVKLVCTIMLHILNLYVDRLGQRSDCGTVIARHKLGILHIP